MVAGDFGEGGAGVNGWGGGLEVEVTGSLVNEVGVGGEVVGYVTAPWVCDGSAGIPEDIILYVGLPTAPDENGFRAIANEGIVINFVPTAGRPNAPGFIIVEDTVFDDIVATISKDDARQVVIEGLPVKLL